MRKITTRVLGLAVIAAVTTASSPPPPPFMPCCYNPVTGVAGAMNCCFTTAQQTAAMKCCRNPSPVNG